VAVDAARTPGLQHTALLLIDLQNDFLARPGLSPPRADVTARAARLLGACREHGVPVVHVRTIVRSDGQDRMPHWQRNATFACVDGSPGALSPEALRPRDDEPVFRKQYFGAFGSPGLTEYLRSLGARKLLLAGVYLHSCVRESALEAYERGFAVSIVDDATGSTEPVHAELARTWLADRAASFITVDDVVGALTPPAPAALDARTLPVACIGGQWRPASEHRTRLLRRPADTRVAIGRVPIAGTREVDAASDTASVAGAAWARRPVVERAELLRRWTARLGAMSAQLTELIVCEIGKPVVEARSEVRRAIGHVETVLRLVERGGVEVASTGNAPRVRHCPVGAVALITPWNNPVAIPVGKIAPALAFGNGVVWKPACEAPETAMTLLASLLEAGAPPGLVNLVFGEADTARRLIASPCIDAISVTGSESTGRSVAAIATLHGKRLQAELGGNNAAIVLADCDVEAVARGLARAAFSFAGQRCTATRRIVVERWIFAPFVDALCTAVKALRVGDPALEETEVGPLISAKSRDRVVAALELALASGGRVLCGGRAPELDPPGYYFMPTLIADLPASAPLVQEETFAPVAVILAANDLDDAISLANAVRQGLVATLCTRSTEVRRRFAEKVEAGILSFAAASLPVHPDAPFGGWKASGIGPPEHGVWDRDFYSRPQAIYE